MSLYEKWLTIAYDKNGANVEKVWKNYLPLEQKVYEEILEKNDGHICGTVVEIGEKYNMSPVYAIGFLDGIRDALDPDGELYEMETLEESSQIDFTVDFTRLYKKMVEYKADHLYALPQWNSVFTTEQRKVLYAEQKQSTTVVRKQQKIGRNEPCPCGSGKKYKQCCGKTA